MIYHVDRLAPAGGDGSAASPFATIQAVAERLEPGDTCLIAGGTYRETVRPARSGTAAAPIVFRPRDGETVILDGTDPVAGWQRLPDGAWRASLSLDLDDANQVFCDGRMMWEARWPKIPNPDTRYLLEFPKATMQAGTTATEIVDPDLPDIDWAGASAWVSSNCRWFSWTGRITAARPGAVTVVDNSDARDNHHCQPGGDYYVFGARGLLTDPNEWQYDAETGQFDIRPPDGEPGARITVKRRHHAFDLRERAHIELHGLHIFAASINLDDDSENLVFSGLRLRCLHHSNRAERQYATHARSGLVLAGRGHLLRDSEIAYAAGSCVVLTGRDCTIVNNHIHDGDYLGTYAACLSFARGTTGHVISHNTIHRAGRHPVQTSGLHDCLFQHNDVGFSGYLTADLGLTYGNCVEGGNSELRYNDFHDNLCPDHCFGIYFDHGCKNLIIHHNRVRGVPQAGLMNNQYANYLLWYDNVVDGAEWLYRSTWQAAQAKDLYGCRVTGNHGTGGIQVKGNGLYLEDNRTYCTELPPTGWVAGHDFADPATDVDTRRSLPPYRNLLVNTAWLNGDLAGWEIAGKHVELCRDPHGQWEVEARAMIGVWSVALGAGRNAVSQCVEGLTPGASYELMAMFRVDPGETAAVGVRQGDGETWSETLGETAPGWARRILRFTANGPVVTVIVAKTSAGPGTVYADDAGLQLQDATRPSER